MPASNMSVQPAGYDMNSGKVIDNDNHPSDQGLNASHDDHWGTKLGLDPMHGQVVPEAPIARYDGDGETKGSVRLK